MNAERLTSAAGGDRFVYTGEAMLWQGETAIRADSIDFDREGGNLAATGAARMALPMKEGLANGRATRIRYTQKDRTLAFGDPSEAGGADSAAAQAARGAAGAGAATAPAAAAPPAQSYLSGPDGEVRADFIAVVLGEGSSATERMDARGGRQPADRRQARHQSAPGLRGERGELRTDGHGGRAR